MSAFPHIEEFISCDCSQEGMHFEYMPGPDDEEHGDFVYVAIWNEGEPRYSWRRRLRHIWRIVRIGRPYSDHIALTRQSVERLRHLCDVVLAAKVYDRPWFQTQRSGECVTSTAYQTTVVTLSVDEDES